MQADATGAVVTTTVSGTSVKFALSGVPTNVVNVAINEGATKIGDFPPAGFPKTITAAIGTHTYTLTGWPTPPGGGGTKVFTLTTTANVTGSVPAPPPPSSPAVTTTVSGTSVSFALSGVPTNVANVAINEGAKKIADVSPAGFPKTITAAAGAHTYTLTGWPTPPGGGGAQMFSLNTSATVSGSVPAPPPPTTSPPLPPASGLPHVSSNGRYLIDGAGNPVLLIGDSPQGIIGQLTPSQFATYVANRKAEGFNTMYFDAIAASYTAGRADGRAADGTAPFTVGSGPSTYDLSMPNNAYFNILDQYVNIITSAGMVPIVDPIETGLQPGQAAGSWMTTLRNNGVAKANGYGRYLGARYAGRIIWMHGNDFETWRTASDDALVTAVRDGIEAADPASMHTVELNYEVNNVVTASASRDDANWENRIDLDAVYTYNPTYAKMLSEYAKSPARPLLFIEGQYENQRFGTAELGTPFVVRRQNWWATTSGAIAVMYSNFSFTNPSAASYLNSSYATTGTRELGYLSAFMRSFAWQTLVPDTGHTFLTGGYGTYASTGDPNNNSYATAAVSANGIGLVYVPTSRAITVNFASFGANPTVRWFNPTNNTYTQVAGPFSGARTLTPPGAHGDGTSDWVLVAQAG